MNNLIKSEEEEGNFWASMRNTNHDAPVKGATAAGKVGEVIEDGNGDAEGGQAFGSGSGRGRGRGRFRDDGGRGRGASKFNGHSHGKAYHDRQREMRGEKPKIVKSEKHSK